MAEVIVLYSGAIVMRRDARKVGEKRYFTGKPCKHGHVAQRRSRDSSCVECVRLGNVRNPYDYVKAWRLENPEARKEEARRYRAKHPEKVVANSLRWRHKNIDVVREKEASNARKRRRNDPEGERRRRKKFKARKEFALAIIAGRPRPSICDICRKNNGGIVFDHCHVGGHFRGWLCDRCNKVLGIAKDDPSLLIKMAKYLERTSGKIDGSTEEQTPGLFVFGAT